MEKGMKTKNVIFMIEGGKALELIKTRIAERRRVTAQNKAIADELGIEEARTDRLTGVLSSVVFKGAIPTGWTKPDSRRCSRPKKGTEWHQRFREQRGYEDQSTVIAEAFGIPLSIEFKSESSHGWRHIGNPLSECGLLYLAPEGPYAMWVPDVPAEVAAIEAEGHAVEEPAKSFKLEFDGCRRIEHEEWEILVLQHKLAAKKDGATRGRAQ